MLASEIERKVLRLFGDSVTSHIMVQAQDIYDWINEAQLRIARDTGCVTGSTSTAASTYPKALPADWIVTKRVVYGITVLRLVDIEDLDAVNVNPALPVDTPCFYYMLGGQIKLYPTLGASDSTTVTFEYSKVPTLITAGAQTPEVPISYHEDLVRYCIMRAHELNENYKAMEMSSNIFEGNLGLRVEEAQLQDDTFYVVRDDPSDTPDVYYVW